MSEVLWEYPVSAKGAPRRADFETLRDIEGTGPF